MYSVQSVEVEGKKRSIFLGDSGGGEASKSENDVNDVKEDDKDDDDNDDNEDDDDDGNVLYRGRGGRGGSDCGSSFASVILLFQLFVRSLPIESKEFVDNVLEVLE